jgi:inner membrane protein involved in colicin E2 resistance
MYKLYWYISTYVHVYIYKDISIVDVHTLPYGVVGVSLCRV